VNLDGKVGEFGDGFQNYRVLGGFADRETPGERSVIRNQHRGNFDGINVPEGAGDDMTGVLFIAQLDFLIGHRVGHRHRTPKIVGVSGTQAGNGPARLGPGRRILGMSVRNAANLREGLVEDQMRREI